MADETGAAPGTEVPLLILVGPTASGKTRLGVALAEQLGAAENGVWMEAVSADSRQIYRGMDIATAKPTAADRERLPHHLLDMVRPDESYTLAQYQTDADAAIAAVSQRGGLPILIGGTGLYIRAVVDNLSIPAVPPDPILRSELEAVAAQEGISTLYAQLVALDPAGAGRIDPRNKRRLIRALEVCLLTGRPISEQQGRRTSPYRPLMLGLTTERQTLYQRADERIDGMLRAGLVEETRELLGQGYTWELPSMSSLGYREIGAYLRREIPLTAAVERFKLSTHGYIRRQLTWFRPDARIIWLDAGYPLATLLNNATALLRPWLSTWVTGRKRSQ